MHENIRKISGGGTNKQRNSNLELLRIVLMYLIIAHHFVVNSGITDLYDLDASPVNTIFLELWGMWGKTAINVFVLISGYFMCTSKLTWQRVLKLWLEVKFYRIVIYVILLITGYTVISIKSFFKLAFGNLYGINNGFTASFLAFYLFIPFYNFLIEKMNKKQLAQLIGLLLFVFTITATFFFNSRVFHHVGWYMVLYFVAAYMRLYPSWWMQSRRFTGIGLVVSLVISYLSVLFIVFVNELLGISFGTYYFVADSHKFMALVVSVFTFLWFNNLQIKQSRFINTVASTAFGVLLIHAHSDAMRTFLWKDLLNVPGMFEYPIGKLVLCAVVCPIGIFVVCSAIDYLRIRFLEKPLFKWIGQREGKIECAVKNVLERFHTCMGKVEDKIKPYF